MKNIFELLFKERNTFAFFIFLICGITILAPLFFNGEVIAEKFSPYHQYPILSFVERSLDGGNLNPLWLPGYMSGYPFFIGPFSYMFPTDIFLKVFDYLTFFNIAVLLSIIFAGFFTYLLSRKLNLSWPASVAAGIIFAFSQLNLWWSSILPFAFVLPLVPLAFLAVVNINSGRYRYLAYGIAGMALGWYVAFTEQVFYLSAFAGLFALYLDLTNKKEFSLSKFRTTLLSAVMLISGVILALPRLLPTFSFIDISVRKFGVPESAASIGWGDIINLLNPYFKIPFTDLAPALKDHEFFLHFGYPVFFLALAGLFLLPKFFKTNRGPLLFFVVLGGASFLMLIKETYIYWIFQQLTFQLFRGRWKLVFLGNFSLALWLGWILDNLTSAREHKQLRALWAGLRYLLLALLGLLVAVNLAVIFYGDNLISRFQQFFAENIYEPGQFQSLDYYVPIVDRTLREMFRYLSLLDYHVVILILGVTTSFLAIYNFLKGRLGENRFKIFYLAILVSYAGLFWQNYYQTLPKTLVETPPQTAQFIKTSLGGSLYRIFRFWPGFSRYNHMGLDQFDKEARFELTKEFLQPNMNITYGIESIEGDENFMAYRHSKILAYVGSFKTPMNESERWLLSEMPFEEKLSRFQSRQNLAVLSMMNVKYLLSSFELKPPLKKVFSHEATEYKLPVYIYENPNVLPRFYLAQGVKFIPEDDDGAFEAVINNPSFKNVTFIECGACDPSGYPRGADRVEIIEYRPGAVSLNVRSTNPRWLVFSESNLPQWEAYVNGKKTDIKTANYLYQGIFIPAGESKVEFIYPGIWRQMRASLDDILNK